MNKETNIKLFRKYVTDFINFYSLHEWEIWVNEQVKPGARASCNYGNVEDIWGQIATISYSKDWIEKENLTDYNIKIVAFHEVTELFISHLVVMAKNKDIVISKREIEKESHRVIRILENRLLPLIKEKEIDSGKNRHNTGNTQKKRRSTTTNKRN